MKILLVNPNSHLSRSGGIGQPIGLVYLASSMLSAKYDVEILDANVLDLPSFDVAFRAKNYDVLGVTSVTSTISEALEICKLSKQEKPNIKIVLGGIHPTIFADSLLEFPYVNAVVKGEGEFAILDYLESLEDGIYERPIPDLSLVASPNYGLLPLDEYRNSLVDTPFLMLMASRGCPYSCIFCAAHLMCGKKIRYFPVEDIVQLMKSSNVKRFLFEDDSLTINKEWTEDLCNRIRDMKVKWWCNSRVDTVDQSILESMKLAGCEGLCYGIESGNQEILDKMKKGITIEQAENAIKLTKKVGMKTYGYFMIGNYGDTEETIRETIDFAKKLNLNFAQFSVTTPFPATELYEVAQKKGIIPRDGWDWSKFDWEGNPPNVSEVSSERLRELLKLALREFYFRPSVIIRNLSLRNVKIARRILR